MSHIIERVLLHMQIICICNKTCNNHDMKRESQFRDYLQLAGERVTAPRLGVFRLLMRYAPMPLSKLIVLAKEDGIDTVTVYRTVDLFRKLGLVQEIGYGRHRRFELSDNFQIHHHHFTCTVCGQMTDFDSETIEAELQRMGVRLGFEIHSHQLEAAGRCARCLVAPKVA
jgi:Fe2+ or Zn2+ uptake regulation protein